jgi:hypothetical protein
MSQFYPSMTTGERILKLVPATSAELLAQLDITSTATLHKWITRLRKDGKIHTGRWRRGENNFVAVHVLGKGKDAKRPKPWTPAQLQARYRKSLKESGRYVDFLIAARKRGYRYRQRRGQKLKIKPDPLLQMFYRQI